MLSKSDTEHSKKLRLEVKDLGLTHFHETLELQYDLVEKLRQNLISNTVLIVSHYPVITLGARGSANVLLTDRKKLPALGIALAKVRRGGGTTAHNPGQIVFYPVVKLSSVASGISEYVQQVEQIGIDLLGELGIDAARRKGFPGVWVKNKKIASVGIRVSRGIAYHGMAINIDNDLSIFDHMIPCGLEGVKMTSAKDITKKEFDIAEVKKLLKNIIISKWA